jgi:hypothetical protein
MDPPRRRPDHRRRDGRTSGAVRIRAGRFHSRSPTTPRPGIGVPIPGPRPDKPDCLRVPGHLARLLQPGASPPGRYWRCPRHRTAARLRRPQGHVETASARRGSLSPARGFASHLRPARERVGTGRAPGGRRCPARERPRRPLRYPAAVALGNSRDVWPRLQRHPQLERPRHPVANAPERSPSRGCCASSLAHGRLTTVAV